MRNLSPLVLFSTLALPLSAGAQTLSAYDIAKKSHETNVGYGGMKADAIMELFDESGKSTVVYKLSQFWLEDGNTTKSMIRFLAPADSKGTALLTHEPKGGSESRWLYLSETRQVKQIGSSNQSASFKGSEFSYEDLATDVLDKFDYKLLSEQKMGGRDCYLIERTPKYADSGYSKGEVCIDKQEFYALGGKAYDKAGKLLKVMEVKDYKKIDGKWRPHYSSVENVQTKKKTIIKSGNFALNLKLSPQMFTVEQLQK